MRQAEIYRKGLLAGILTEDGGEYRFCYDEGYLKDEGAQPVSLLRRIGPDKDGHWEVVIKTKEIDL